MTEEWKYIPGFEGRYEVSSYGRVRAVSFRQRYLLRNGQAAYRVKKPHEVAQQQINSGYLIVHLHLDGVRKAMTVHRLVAAAFCGTPRGDVNHLNGDKTDNRCTNLEWTDRTSNHLHAVGLGLNRQAQPVLDPRTGISYPSVTQAARGARVSHRTVRAQFVKEEKRVPR